MKQWLKILKGDVIGELSASTIQKEIDSLQSQQNDYEKTTARLSADLNEVRLENLGGVKNSSKIIKIEDQLLKTTSKIAVCVDAISRLRGKLTIEHNREVQAEIDEIDQNISDLKSEKEDLEKQFFDLAGRTAALGHLIFPKSSSFTIGKKHYPVPVVGEKRAFFDGAFQEGIDNRQPFAVMISQLVERKNQLSESLL